MIKSENKFDIEHYSPEFAYVTINEAMNVITFGDIVGALEKRIGEVQNVVLDFTKSSINNAVIGYAISLFKKDPESKTVGIVGNADVPANYDVCKLNETNRIRKGVRVYQIKSSEKVH